MFSGTSKTYVIFNGMNTTELRKISTCESAKEAWDILKATHEGTTVKQSMIQNLTKDFEKLIMEDDNSFDDF